MGGGGGAQRGGTVVSGVAGGKVLEVQSKAVVGLPSAHRPPLRSAPLPAWYFPRFAPLAKLLLHSMFSSPSLLPPLPLSPYTPTPR